MFATFPEQILSGTWDTEHEESGHVHATFQSV